MKLDVMIKKEADELFAGKVSTTTELTADELDFQAIYAENDNNMKDYDGPKLVFAKSLKPGDDCKYPRY